MHIEHNPFERDRASFDPETSDEKQARLRLEQAPDNQKVHTSADLIKMVEDMLGVHKVLDVVYRFFNEPCKQVEVSSKDDMIFLFTTDEIEKRLDWKIGVAVYPI